MTSTELVDLLYVAYNRDDADVYGIDKALKAGYNELYSTAPDYMDKKMRMLDEQIARDAARLANEKVIEAQTEKQKEYEKKVTTRDDIISNLAQLIIEQNEAMLGKDIAEKSKEKVRREKKSLMFKKNKKSQMNDFNIRNDYTSDEEVRILHKKTIKELIAPSGIDASSIDHLEIASNVKKICKKLLRICTSKNVYIP